MAKEQSGDWYQVKVTLLKAPLPIWRRLIITADAPLELVHEILQIAMGWTNSHVHEFRAKGDTYGDTDGEDNSDDLKDETQFVLCDLLKEPGDIASYEYDAGDSWQHEILLEKIADASREPLIARCLTGKRACPPEDVGGVAGYKRFLEVIEDPDHIERDEMLEWLGCEFDPDCFDARLVNWQLALIEEVLTDQAIELASRTDLN